MSAAEKVVKPTKLGILAGGGEIPRMLVEACEKQSIEPFVVAFEGQTDPKSYAGRSHIIENIGSAGRIMKRLKEEGVVDLVLIGRIRRPSIKELKPDLKTAEFFARDAIGAIGDDGVLKALRGFLERHGFKLHAVQEFMPEMLTPEGVLTKKEPSAAHKADIQRGVELLKSLSPYDVGQAVVIQQGHVLGIEGAEGTDALIERCAGLQRKGEGAILVKLAKTGQDQALDLPTIGLRTIHSLEAARFVGAAIHSGESLIVDLEAVQEHANRGKLFLVGVKV